MKKQSLPGLFLFIFLLLAQTLYSQSPVTGVVVSEDDQQPLIGVTVTVKGTTEGTQTDAQGRFSLNASTDDILVFSYVSFNPQEVPVGQQRNLSVVMKPNVASLNEVVVVGYGTQSRSSITGSIARLDTEVLANSPRSNVATALQGTVPGLQAVIKTGKTGSAEVSYKYTGGFNKRREGYNYLNAGDYIHYTRLGYLNANRSEAQVNSSRGLGLLTDAANLATFDIRRYTTDLDHLLN